jgi:hypothetical protein
LHTGSFHIPDSTPRNITGRSPPRITTTSAEQPQTRHFTRPQKRYTQVNTQFVQQLLDFDGQALAFRHQPMMPHRRVADREVAGHWEGDLITGEANRSAIGTLVERSSRYVILLYLPGRHTAEAVRGAVVEAMKNLPARLRRSLTWDQGSEMALHAEIAAALGTAGVLVPEGQRSRHPWLSPPAGPIQLRPGAVRRRTVLVAARMANSVAGCDPPAQNWRHGTVGSSI